MLERLGLMPPQASTFAPQVDTLYAFLLMVTAFFSVLIAAFGNFLIPLMIGARDMAFPSLNMLSFWTFVVSQVLVLASFGAQLGSAAARPAIAP